MAALYNEAMRKQPLTFDGLRTAGNSNTTDIDMLVDYGTAFLLGECKMYDKQMADAQKCSYECLVRAVSKAGFPIWAFLFWHKTITDTPIKVCDQEVGWVYYKSVTGNFVWFPIKTMFTVQQLVKRFEKEYSITAQGIVHLSGRMVKSGYQ